MTDVKSVCSVKSTRKYRVKCRANLRPVRTARFQWLLKLEIRQHQQSAALVRREHIMGRLVKSRAIRAPKAATMMAKDPSTSQTALCARLVHTERTPRALMHLVPRRAHLENTVQMECASVLNARKAGIVLTVVVPNA